MVTIYKIIDGKESELGCSTIEDAEKMVKSNPEKYSFESRKQDEVFEIDESLISENEELKNENENLKIKIEEFEKAESEKVVIPDPVYEPQIEDEKIDREVFEANEFVEED